MKKWLLPFVSALWLSGCSGTSDNILPPLELRPIEATLAVTQAWEANSGEGNDGDYTLLAPFAAAQRVFAVDHKGKVSAWDAGSGKALWKTDLDAATTAGVSGDQSLVVVGSAEGRLVGLSADSGSVKWQTRLTSQVTAISDIDSGMLVARSLDGRVHGVDAGSGQVRWSWQREMPKLSLRGQAKPVLARGAVFLGMDDGTLVLLALQTGAPVWEAVVATGRGRTELDRLVDVDGEPVLAGSELFVVAYQGKLVAIDARRGSVLWSRDASSNTGVSVDSRAVYYSDEHGIVYAVSRNSGIELWKQEGLKYRKVTRPALMGNSVVVADFEGYLHWLDASSGKFVQRRRADSGGVLAAPVIWGDKLLVLGNRGALSLWQLDK